jgi:Fur family ferric uptake transcriptional regulator/Fur family zinc uptake transcriptional regulator
MKNPEDLLRERGIRPTELRKEVLRILFGAGRPLSWKDTFTRFTEKRVNKVSLYRTLSLLEEKGLVHKILGTDGAWHYCAHLVEGKKCPGNHPHFLCLACGRMFCLEDQPLPRCRFRKGASWRGSSFLPTGAAPPARERSRRGDPTASSGRRTRPG